MAPPKLSANAAVMPSSKLYTNACIAPAVYRQDAAQANSPKLHR
jgi:hypothetical protein